MDHYNDGKTQGSIIIAAEGMYNIRKTNFDSKKIDIDEDNLFRAFRDTYSNRNNIVELNEKQTDDLIQKCEKNGVTVNSALNTAFLAARTSILGPFKGGKQNIMVPVNTRNKYKKPVGDNIGVYVSGFQFKFSYNPKKDFWRWTEYRHTVKGKDWKNAKVITAGIDVGSVSVNLAVMDAQDNVIEEQYIRHHAHPMQRAAQALQQAVDSYGRERIAGLAATGNGGRTVARILGADFVNEDIFSLSFDGDGLTGAETIVPDSGVKPSSFGIDQYPGAGS